jgi:hypothetical protein
MGAAALGWRAARCPLRRRHTPPHHRPPPHAPPHHEVDVRLLEALGLDVRRRCKGDQREERLGRGEGGRAGGGGAVRRGAAGGWRASAAAAVCTRAATGAAQRPRPAPGSGRQRALARHRRRDHPARAARGRQRLMTRPARRRGAAAPRTPGPGGRCPAPAAGDSAPRHRPCRAGPPGARRGRGRPRSRSRPPPRPATAHLGDPEQQLGHIVAVGHRDQPLLGAGSRGWGRTRRRLTMRPAGAKDGCKVGWLERQCGPSPACRRLAPLPRAPPRGHRAASALPATAPTLRPSAPSAPPPKACLLYPRRGRRRSAVSFACSVGVGSSAQCLVRKRGLLPALAPAAAKATVLDANSMGGWRRRGEESPRGARTRKERSSGRRVAKTARRRGRNWGMRRGRGRTRGGGPRGGGPARRRARGRRERAAGARMGHFPLEPGAKGAPRGPRAAPRVSNAAGRQRAPARRKHRGWQAGGAGARAGAGTWASLRQCLGEARMSYSRGGGQGVGERRGQGQRAPLRRGERGARRERTCAVACRSGPRCVQKELAWRPQGPRGAVRGACDLGAESWASLRRPLPRRAPEACAGARGVWGRRRWVEERPAANAQGGSGAPLGRGAPAGAAGGEPARGAGGARGARKVGTEEAAYVRPGRAARPGGARRSRGCHIGAARAPAGARGGGEGTVGSGPQCSAPRPRGQACVRGWDHGSPRPETL